MNYKQSMDYIEKISEYGSVLGLSNMTELMCRLGNPQDKLKYIHIAGTNGKGSVSAYISSVLIEAGYRVGIYSSPSVFSYLEKIKFGRKNISQKDFAGILSKVSKVADTMEVHPTVFEVETACAFLYFFEKDCDVVVLECGLGGDEDATNIIKTTCLSIITSISLDHTKILGNTLEKIAAKKAGIIKKGVPVVTCAQKESVIKLLENVAKECNTNLFVAPSGTALKVKKEKFPTTVFDGFGYENLEINMPGTVQYDNVQLSLQAIKTLKELDGFDFGDRLSESVIRKGLKKATNPGRLSQIYNSPRIIIDGAHNPDAALGLRNAIDKYFKKECMIFIVGVLADKDYEKVLECMCDRANQIITVATPNNSRALDSYSLAQSVMKYNPNVSNAASVEEALELALLFAKKKDIILAFGSLSYLGLFKEAVDNRL